MIIPCSQSESNHKELFSLENQLRQKELIREPVVQKFLRLAYSTSNDRFYEFAIDKLKLVLKANNIRQMRQPDEFCPYCPRTLSKKGSLHLVKQIDGEDIYIDYNKLVTGLGIFGPQGAGKSYYIADFCSKIRQLNPNIKITIIDPKGAFSNLRDFEHIDLLESSFDLMPPDNISPEVFIYELMPILAQTTGLIYGLELLNQAVDITLCQRSQISGGAGIAPNICLKDIYQSLSLLKVSGFRKTGYHDASTTALSLILGKQNLFACRKGLSLNRLFNQNTVLNARCLTDDMQCRFFITFLLYWLYQRARYNPETNQIKHILIIDDATRFIGSMISQFDGHSKTSPLGHILAVLRSTGVCLVYATQLPSKIDSSVLSLTRNILIIGNINGEDNLRTIQGLLSLNNEQKKAISRFKNRETLAFVSGNNWPHPIHGWTPYVNISDYITVSPSKLTIDTEPWQSLTEIPLSKEKQTEETTGAEPVKIEAIGPVDKLILDCIHYPFSKAREHAERLDSTRQYESAKTQALQEGFLIASQCGKSLYLIATQKSYDKFSIPNPYKRPTSIEHAFYVALAGEILKKNTDLKIQTETAIGKKGATIDMTSVDKSGNMAAFEITLSTSNLSSNASKLQDTSYEKIVWLCRDDDTAKAVKAYFNKSSSLPPQLVSKFEYTFFSKWIKQIKKGGK